MLWLLLIYACLGIPSLLFYILILILMVRNRNVFVGTYYLLMLYGGILGILTYLINMLFLCLMNFEEMIPFYQILTKIPGIQYTLWLPTSSFHLFSMKVIWISIHRLVLLMNPLDGDEKFRPFLRPGLAGIPIASFLLTGYVPFQHPQMIVSETRTEWIMDEGENFYKITVYFAGFYAVAIASLTIASFLLMRQHRNMGKTIRRLTIISTFTNIIQLGFTCIMILKIFTMYGSSFDHILDIYFLPSIIFVACLATPWIHIAFNKTMQEQLKRSLCKKS